MRVSSFRLFQRSSVPQRQADATCLPWVSDLWQQTTSLGRLRQMETNSVSVSLFTEQARCGSFSGTRVLLPHLSTGSDRYTDMVTIHDQRTVRKLTLRPLFLAVFLPYGGIGMSCVQAIANSPLAL